MKSILIIAILCLLVIEPIVLISLSRWGRSVRKKAQEYDEKYAMIKFYLKDWDDIACEKLLLAFIDELESLPYKNQEKTEILRNEILVKFAKEPTAEQIRKAEEKISAISN